MTKPKPLLIGKGEDSIFLDPKIANRHGLIAGATGTGKTVTLQILAESFSEIGVPVFMADVKGDLSGLCQEGKPHPKLAERAATIGMDDYRLRRFPVLFWDLFGVLGHPVRTTISEMGPLLLARLLDLNETQEGVLNIAFKVADDEGMLLLDLKDLRAMLNHVAENARELGTLYGNVSRASVGAILRRLLVLEQEGGDEFFGEPALDLRDFLRRDFSGQGVINILAADTLMESPRLYATFLLWLLSELFEELPEVGDLEKPKLVFFFDEAHLLFDDAPKALLRKVEQVVRLIRSKGVGIYFVTQSPTDVPDSVLRQLGNRIQHALRAFTPREQKTIRVVAETFRQNPKLEVETVLTQLGVGEALVSVLDREGVPGIVQQTLIRPPSSRLGPAENSIRDQVFANSPLSGQYDAEVDRESAYEMLQARAERVEREREEQERQEAAEKARSREAKERARSERDYQRRNRRRRSRSRRSDSAGEALVKSVARSIGSSLGRKLVRGILGSILR